MPSRSTIPKHQSDFLKLYREYADRLSEFRKEAGKDQDSFRAFADSISEFKTQFERTYGKNAEEMEDPLDNKKLTKLRQLCARAVWNADQILNPDDEEYANYDTSDWRYQCAVKFQSELARNLTYLRQIPEQPSTGDSDIHMHLPTLTFETSTLKTPDWDEAYLHFPMKFRDTPPLSSSRDIRGTFTEERTVKPKKEIIAQYRQYLKDCAEDELERREAERLEDAREKARVEYAYEDYYDDYEDDSAEDENEYTPEAYTELWDILEQMDETVLADAIKKRILLKKNLRENYDKKNDTSEGHTEIEGLKDLYAYEEKFFREHPAPENREELEKILKGFGKEYSENAKYNSLYGANVGSGIEERSCAMSAAAMLLDKEDVLEYAQKTTITERDGTEVEGCFREKLAPYGSDFRNLTPKDPLQRLGQRWKDGQKSTSSEKIFANAKRNIADIQVIDFICGNFDRTPNDLIYYFDSTADPNVRDGLLNVVGIHNTHSFFTQPDPEKEQLGLRSLNVITRSMRNAIFRFKNHEFDKMLEQFNLSLEERQAAAGRLEQLKQYITESEKNAENKSFHGLRVVPDNDFKDISWSELAGHNQAGYNLFRSIQEDAIKIADMRIPEKYGSSDVEYKEVYSARNDTRTGFRIPVYKRGKQEETMGEEEELADTAEEIIEPGDEPEMTENEPADPEGIPEEIDEEAVEPMDTPEEAEEEPVKAKAEAAEAEEEPIEFGAVPSKTVDESVIKTAGAIKKNQTVSNPSYPDIDKFKYSEYSDLTYGEQVQAIYDEWERRQKRLENELEALADEEERLKQEQETLKAEEQNLDAELAKIEQQLEPLYDKLQKSWDVRQAAQLAGDRAKLTGKISANAEDEAFAKLEADVRARQEADIRARQEYEARKRQEAEKAKRPNDVPENQKNKAPANPEPGVSADPNGRNIVPPKPGASTDQNAGNIEHPAANQQRNPGNPTAPENSRNLFSAKDANALRELGRKVNQADPFWLFKGSDQFKQMKTALKDVSDTLCVPGINGQLLDADQLYAQMNTLRKAARKYLDYKGARINQPKNEREKKRIQAARDIVSFTRGKMEEIAIYTQEEKQRQAQQKNSAQVQQLDSQPIQAENGAQAQQHNSQPILAKNGAQVQQRGSQMAEPQAYSGNSQPVQPSKESQVQQPDSRNAMENPPARSEEVQSNAASGNDSVLNAKINALNFLDSVLNEKIRLDQYGRKLYEDVYHTLTSEDFHSLLEKKEFSADEQEDLKHTIAQMTGLQMLVTEHQNMNPAKKPAEGVQKGSPENPTLLKRLNENGVIPFVRPIETNPEFAKATKTITPEKLKNFMTQEGMKNLVACMAKKNAKAKTANQNSSVRKNRTLEQNSSAQKNRLPEQNSSVQKSRSLG